MMEGEELSLNIGDRVLVKGKELTGTVKFFGPTDFAPTGVWVGIALDVPKGKNNGTVQGKAYFTCPDNHGMFLRSGMVSVVKNTSPSQKGTSAKKTAIPTAGPSTSSGPQRSKVCLSVYTHKCTSFTSHNMAR